MSANKSLFLAAVMALGLATGAAADTYPSKLVRIVIPFAPGGLVDVHARALANELGKVWKSGVVVENVPGAANNIAAERVARSAPDGYTIFVGNNGPLVNNPYLFKTLGYDPAKDFEPVAAMYAAESAFIIKNDIPAKNLREFVELAKKKPGAFNYGSHGIGSNTHIEIELFSRQLGIQLTHIPFKGDAAPVIERGEVDAGITSAAAGQIARGTVRPVSLLNDKRSHVLPNVATPQEEGFKPFISLPFFGLVVPKGTPQPVIETIAKEAGRISQDPVFVEKVIHGGGLVPFVLGPKDFGKFLDEQRKAAATNIPSLNIPMN